MAQKIQVLLVCDMCDDGKPGTDTVEFGMDGAGYEIDLCDKHTKALRDSVAPFVGNARRASANGRRGGARRRQASSLDRERTQEIRAWARKKGLEVSERGRISSKVVQAFEAAQRGK